MQAITSVEINTTSDGYDYIFCGTGASATLLLLELERINLLTNKRILLIDPDKKDKRDKTFCFWADVEEPISVHLNQLISHDWDKVALSEKDFEHLWPLRYNHISSIDLYNRLHELTKKYNWDKISTYADKVAADEQGPFVIVNNRKIRAAKVFDSRPPSYKQPVNGETHIYQSFVGWMIETETEMEKSTSFRFMDFQIEQQGSTQFVYVLPFSSNKALIEVTRFGEEIINRADAEELLRLYIERHYGKYVVLDIETGCIPMSNAGIEQTDMPGITSLGTRNYQIKPSTGYAFKNMYYHARDIASAIKNNISTDALNRSHQLSGKGRFAFYDDLLLDILKNKPQEGKGIFIALLQKVETRKILTFLDEKTRLKDDIAIFWQLPWWPFVSTLLKKCPGYSWFRPTVLTFITILLMLVGSYGEWQSNIAYALFFSGLVLVGIPHGAVDHLLETGKWDLKEAPVFILKYLSLSALMGLMWYLLPQLALLVFLAYSSWHFGQADGKKWQFSKPAYMLWGVMVLFYILGTHLPETNSILNLMGNTTLPWSCPVWVMLPWLAWALFRKQASFALTIIWLMLSAQLPLLISFGLYFIGQHSLTGWQHIRSHLQISHSRIWLHSLPFHAGAWLLLAGFLFFWPAVHPFQELNRWAVFFIFIACISFPHTIYMNAVYRGKGVSSDR